MCDGKENPHVVVEGDWFSRVSWKHGFRNWRAAWDYQWTSGLHAGDGFLDRHGRDNPHLIFPGDMLYFAPLSADPEPAHTNRRIVLETLDLRSHLRLIVQDEWGRPFAGREYALTHPGQPLPAEGRRRTGSNGELDEAIDFLIDHLILTVWVDDPPGADTVSWRVLSRLLAPLGTIPGTRQRLENLGFYREPHPLVLRKLGRADTAALRAFQQESGHRPADGKLDLDTLHRLATACQETPPSSVQGIGGGGVPGGAP